MEKINSAKKEVIATGVFQSFGKEDSTLVFKYNEVEYVLIFSFVDDSTNQQTVEFNPVENTTLKMVFKNFNNLLGTYNTEPIDIGFATNRKLYCNINIADLGKIRKQVFYTIYLGETNAQE